MNALYLSFTFRSGNCNINMTQFDCKRWLYIQKNKIQFLSLYLSFLLSRHKVSTPEMSSSVVHPVQLSYKNLYL